MTTTVTWIGKSRKSYVFELHLIGQEFNPVSGVYIFCKPVGQSSMEALYVGETQSLHDRLNTGIENHDGFKRASRAGMTHIAVMSSGNLAERLRIETDLRHGIDPKCNRQAVNALANAFLHR